MLFDVPYTRSGGKPVCLRCETWVGGGGGVEYGVGEAGSNYWEAQGKPRRTVGVRF